MSTRIISYNVNGIRAASNKGFGDWLKSESPDILCVQEIKAQPDHLNKLGLCNRQVKAVLFVKENDSISNSDYQKLNKIGKTTATEELTNLVDLKIFLPRTAKGRGAKYRLL
jgi:exonuclease III